MSGSEKSAQTKEQKAELHVRKPGRALSVRTGSRDNGEGSFQAVLDSFFH